MTGGAARPAPTLAEVVEILTLKTTDCWYWLGNICTNTRYGRLTFRGARLAAHRVSYELAKGAIPEGLEIDHLCRNRECINPNHLEAVSHRTNTLRGMAITARAARASHCPKGHPRIEQNIYLERGMRLCSICRDARNKFHNGRRPRSERKPGGQFRSHCLRGHELSGDNLYVSAKGQRNCKACNAIRARIRRGSAA